MQNIIEIYNNLSIYIVGILIILIIILLINMFVNIKAINRLESKYRKLTRGVENNNIEELIESYMDKIDNINNDSIKIKNEYNGINEKVNKCLQNISIVRYKAFEDVGSDLSFSIALLDNNNDGVVITSIYGRNESTTYAKPIDKGISRYDLSDEEEYVLKDAVSKK
ncbi:hypothetical protein CPAST_c40880 [Clostridium pasteurianum DSM 525 = ATCC 6013]|uniref:DUF4446 domain-containing protein n=1 Tax=Clostridium pasteurianum DSM 525 = ATCC 6013 TaxID=1262449 RepID=A0A0H3J9R9_CLOPA|nr:DUF4446 family protein [Clostridium pasteurianum]AJA50117.1 hypothetical protein CPAST_c40880 [Clostridium pasteurianum DSM 525 = ATCC 6013]AJA54105.1 hypothetical protein CLPA_c40880 [Clostridium pasteurianum DSM 525 = ATCC 6013]AOZ77231.1 hypothetical protein AQ983_19850 [Clostridium pasteurianum DSM 525 = ATCC 6013]AOZ81027.1 hypothetical protein AQ984_19845 [Clostridium pasteurianum]ELP59184.1 hypothetical protein F502_09888 [Clostridium pasteurianum DSM 525 = ATCC 6013]